MFPPKLFLMKITKETYWCCILTEYTYLEYLIFFVFKCVSFRLFFNQDPVGTKIFINYSSVNMSGLWQHWSPQTTSKPKGV